MMQKFERLLNLAVVIALGLFIFGCGESSTTSTSELTGTVATGAPVAQGTQVILKDANGTSRSTTTLDANGLYKISVGDLTPPFAICVDTTTPPPATPCATGTGTSDKVLLAVVSSIKPGTSTSNVTPLTKLAAASAAGVSDPTSIFNTIATLKALTADKITQGLSAITSLVGDYLKTAGIDPSTFNPLTTQFKADHTGVDSVLDAVKPKLGSDGTVSVSFKGYSSSSKPSFDISKPFGQYSTQMRISMKNSWTNVATQITPIAGGKVTIPDGVTLPSGLNIPSGTTIPASATLPGGFAVPAGVILASGIKLPDNVDLSTMTTTMPSGVSIPANATVPASWQTSPPPGVTIPPGVKYYGSTSGGGTSGGTTGGGTTGGGSSGTAALTILSSFDKTKCTLIGGNTYGTCGATALMDFNLTAGSCTLTKVGGLLTATSGSDTVSATLSNDSADTATYVETIVGSILQLQAVNQTSGSNTAVVLTISAVTSPATVSIDVVQAIPSAVVMHCK